MIRILSISLLVLTLVGCFGKKSLDCAAINWTQKGLEDGKLGLDETNVLKLKQKCDDQGVTASVVDYKQGWLLGIEIYCSPKNAFMMSKSGQKALKQNNCPVEFKTNFAESFKRGQDLKKINDKLGPFKKRAKNLAQQKKELAAKINETDSEISKVENRIFELNQQKENIKRLSKDLEPDDVTYKTGDIGDKTVL